MIQIFCKNVFVRIKQNIKRKKIFCNNVFVRIKENIKRKNSPNLHFYYFAKPHSRTSMQCLFILTVCRKKILIVHFSQVSLPILHQTVEKPEKYIKQKRNYIFNSFSCTCKMSPNSSSCGVSANEYSCTQEPK